ncbi:MAG TPA: hypothetical protein VD997_07735 [Phycisphaerales bacterium]|nr:hypothetical protein [Phycisphaerales bacterium]
MSVGHDGTVENGSRGSNAAVSPNVPSTASGEPSKAAPDVPVKSAAEAGESAAVEDVGPVAIKTEPEPQQVQPQMTEPQKSQRQKAVPTNESQSLGTIASRSPLTTTEAVAGTAMLLGVLLIAYFLKYRMNRKPAQRAAAQGGAGAEDRELLGDIRELTDRLASELDAKAERLERLLRAADERIRTLEAAHKETRLIEPKGEVRRPAAYDQSHRDVYDLADQGLSVIEIAQRLDRPTGQVELILNLRKGTVAL